jgi:hypothetical protein
MSLDDDIFDLVSSETSKKDEGPVESTINDLVPLADSRDILVIAATNAGIKIPEEKLSILQGFMVRAQHGHQAALPMNCKGTSCPFIGMCPLRMADLELPVGKDCPVEQALIEGWVQKTVTALNIDAGDPEFAVDLDMVYELAGMELLRMRAGHHLAKDPSLVEEKIVGYSPQGQPIYDEKPKVALLILEKYSKVVNKLREQLLATRKAQAQAGQFAGDVSVRTANIMERARKIAETRRAGGNISDAEYQVTAEVVKEEDKQEDGPKE